MQGLPVAGEEQVLLAWQVKALRIALILLVSLFVYSVLRTMARRLAGKIPQKRLATILSLSYSLISLFVFGITALIVLREFNVDIAPILASAGIVGLAVGFGAQSLVRDLITGLFILTEDQVRLGDIVIVGDSQGKVEKIGLQSLHLRDLSGALHLIPNSQVGKIINLTRDFSHADLQIGVSAKHPIDEVLKVISSVAKDVQKEFKEEITTDPEILGVEEIAGGKLTVRVLIRTRPKKQFEIERRFLYLLKKAFEEKGLDFA